MSPNMKPFNRQRSTSRTARLTALACLLAIVAVACGTGSTEIGADATIDLGAPAPAPAPAVAENTSENGPAYGASLEEFGHSRGTQAPDLTASSTSADGDDAADQAPSIIWEDLIPAGASGQDIVSQYEERLDAVEPGSPEARVLYDEMQAQFDPAAVNTELDGQEIRLAGFVAPLTYEGDLVTEFLLVPTFGACIHVPPPPPNQTIMVTLDSADALTTDESWGAVWVQGTISITAVTTDLASASYVITNATSGTYQDF